MIPHRVPPRPFAIPEDRDGVADRIGVPGPDLYRNIVCARIEEVPAPRRSWTEVESKLRVFWPRTRNLHLVSGGQVDVKEVDMALGSGMHRGHRQRWARSRPGQREPDRSRLGRCLLRVPEPPKLGHHHDDVVGRVLSRLVRHPQPDMSCVGSALGPDDDLIVSGVVEAKIQSWATARTQYRPPSSPTSRARAGPRETHRRRRSRPPHRRATLQRRRPPTRRTPPPSSRPVPAADRYTIRRFECGR